MERGLCRQHYSVNLMLIFLSFQVVGTFLAYVIIIVQFAQSEATAVNSEESIAHNVLNVLNTTLGNP